MGDGFELIDLGSTNGTWWQGTKVGELVVPPGATVKFGGTSVRLAASDAPSPYVDAHGEQDIALRRGRPLALCAARYAALAALLAGGGVAREVAAQRSVAARVWKWGVF